MSTCLCLYVCMSVCACVHASTCVCVCLHVCVQLFKENISNPVHTIQPWSR